MVVLGKVVVLTALLQLTIEILLQSAARLIVQINTWLYNRSLTSHNRLIQLLLEGRAKLIAVRHCKIPIRCAVLPLVIPRQLKRSMQTVQTQSIRCYSVLFLQLLKIAFEQVSIILVQTDLQNLKFWVTVLPVNTSILGQFSRSF